TVVNDRPPARLPRQRVRAAGYDHGHRDPDRTRPGRVATRRGIAPKLSRSIRVRPPPRLGTLGEVAIDGGGFDCVLLVEFGSVSATAIGCIFTQMVAVPPLHLSE